MMGPVHSRFSRLYCCCAVAAWLAVSATPAGAQLAVSAANGNGGNAAAAPNADFVEIFNRSCAPVDLDAYSVQIASSAGTVWTVIPLPAFVLQPGQYYAIRCEATFGTGFAYTADQVGTTSPMSSGGGKAAIVRGDAALSGDCPAATENLVDFVKFRPATGAVACTEGLPADSTAATITNGKGVERLGGGCTDTNVNRDDFFVPATVPGPRTTATAVNVCAPQVDPNWGGCILPAGNCQVLTEAACDGLAGSFLGECTACPPAGACCLTDGTCSIRVQTACEADALFLNWAAGQTCTPGRCQGRCCATDGGCTVTGTAGCLAPSVFGGLGTNCALIPSGDPTTYGGAAPATLPIATTTAADTVINVPDSYSIADVNVRVLASHTFRGDIFIQLISPAGTTRTIFDACAGEDHLNALIDDEAAAIVCATAGLGNLAGSPVAIDTTPTADQLSGFDGENSAGDWTLRVSDQFAGADSGTLLAWELVLTRGNSACAGACCQTNGTCQVLSSSGCAQAGGTYRGDATGCSPNPCVPNGACCLNAICTIQSQAECQTLGGVYGGDASACTSPAPCQAPCCKADGTCQLLTVAACSALSGGQAGALGAACPAAPCAPLGACCAEDGGCTPNVTQFACTAAGGFRWTAGGACSPNVCVGRCCAPDGSCSLQFDVNCQAPNTFGGNGTLCDAVSVFNFNGVNLPVPGTPGAVNIQNVTQSGTITDLDVDVAFAHTWFGDLTVTIEHLGTVVTIIDQPGVPAIDADGCPSNNPVLVLDDEGAGGPVEDLCAAGNDDALPVPPSPPSYVPNNPLSAFDGLNMQGAWTIRVSDAVTGFDSGTLLSWSLHVLTAASPCNGACCVAGNACQQLSSADCTTAGGTFLGLGTVCGGVNPCLPSGACCVGLTCSVQNESTCQDLGGSYGGNGSICDASACGRCCSAGGTCSVTAAVACAGTFTAGEDCLTTTAQTFGGLTIPIPDGVTTGVSDIRTVSGLGGMTMDVNVGVKITHGWYGDLIVQIEHLGTIVVMIDRAGVPSATFGCSADNPNILLDDEGTGGSAEALCDADADTFVDPSPPARTPNNPLSAFDGLDPNGDWTLTVIDPAADFPGTLTEWSLILTSDGAVCASAGCACRGDLNGDALVNGRDVQQFAACVIGGGGAGCDCADVNGVGGVTAADIGPFVSALLAGACAP